MQSQFGVAYEKDGFIMFQAQVLELPTVVSTFAYAPYAEFLIS